MLLARTLGRTLNELMHTMTAEEFGLWQQSYLQDPWGEERADLRAGIIAATIANVHRGKDTEPYKAADFKPNYSKPKPAETSEESPEQFFDKFKG
jgi:hypothetical protein